MNCGIYAIEHVESGRLYIGSAYRFQQRWWCHQSDLRNNRHHSPFLQQAWNKYGEAAFVFKKLLICSKEHCLYYEQRAIDAYQAADHVHGFNVCASAYSRAGHTPSAETRAKIKAGRAKQIFTPETRAKLKAAAQARVANGTSVDLYRHLRKPLVHSEASRAKMSAKLKGRRANRSFAKKMTYEKVAEARRLFAEGKHINRELAKMYGVGEGTMSLILRNKIWIDNR